MWRWLARITTGLALGSFGAVLLFLAAIVVFGVLAFVWIMLWGDLKSGRTTTLVAKAR